MARRDDGIALILIAESPKCVIKPAIHPGNPGLGDWGLGRVLMIRIACECLLLLPIPKRRYRD